MTRKDYILLAKAIRKAQAEVTDMHDVAVIYQTTKHIADALVEDNPRFDRDRFLRASADH